MAEINVFQVNCLTANEKKILRKVLQSRIRVNEAHVYEGGPTMPSTRNETYTLIGLMDMLCAEFVSVTTADLR